jgi:hypothetical protein
MATRLKRKPRSRLQLLPFAPAVVTAASLRHHNALAMFCRGEGTLEHLAGLARVVYLAWLMESADGSVVRDREMFRIAERTLECCLARNEGGDSLKLDPAEATLIAPVLLLHDKQLADCLTYQYQDAWAVVVSAVGSRKSPLAGRDATPDDSAFFVRMVMLLEQTTGLRFA